MNYQYISHKASITFSHSWLIQGFQVLPYHCSVKSCGAFFQHIISAWPRMDNKDSAHFTQAVGRTTLVNSRA